MPLFKTCFSCISSVHICILCRQFHGVYLSLRKKLFFMIIFSLLFKSLFATVSNVTCLQFVLLVLLVILILGGLKNTCKNILLQGFQLMGYFVTSFYLMWHYMGHSSFLDLEQCLGCTCYKIALNFNKSNTKIQNGLGLITAVLLH